MDSGIPVTVTALIEVTVTSQDNCINSFLDRIIYCCVTDYPKTYLGTSSWRNGYVAGLPCSLPQFESRTRWLKLTPGACACVPKILRAE